MASQDNNKKNKMTSKQIVALSGVVLLVLMYIVTLFAAIFDNSASGYLFRASLIASFCIPFLIWIYVWMYGRLTRKKTFADMNYNMGVNQSETNNDTE